MSSVKIKSSVIVVTQKELMARNEKRDKLKRNQSPTLRVAASSCFVFSLFPSFNNLQIRMGFVEDPTYALSHYNHNLYMLINRAVDSKKYGNLNPRVLPQLLLGSAGNGRWW